MNSLYAEDKQDLESIFDKLQRYEAEESVHRVQPDFTDRGDMLLQTDSYNAIITPDNVQVKGLEHTNTDLLDLAEAEKNAFDYLKSRYEHSSRPTRSN